MYTQHRVMRMQIRWTLPSTKSNIMGYVKFRCQILKTINIDPYQHDSFNLVNSMWNMIEIRL